MEDSRSRIQDGGLNFENLKIREEKPKLEYCWNLEIYDENLNMGKMKKKRFKDIGLKMWTTRYKTNWFIPRTLVIIIFQHFRTRYRLSQVQAISVIDAMSVSAPIIIVVVVVVVVFRNVDFNLDGMISNEKDLYLNALKKDMIIIQTNVFNC